MNIVPADFSGNPGLDDFFVTDEAEDSIGWVPGDLADELELDDEVYVLVTRSQSCARYQAGMRAYTKTTRNSGNHPGRHCDRL